MSLALIIAAAAPFADPVVLDRAVARFTGSAIGAPGGARLPVDRRLRLRPCSGPPELAWHTARRESVIILCPDPGGWRLFVPVITVQAAAPEPPTVRRGEAVSITVSGEGFSLTQPGEALEAGATGSWIRVRKASARPGPNASDTLRARVTGPGTVALPLP